MKKNLITLLGIFLAALFMSGCAAQRGMETGSAADMENHTVTIAAGQFHEYCEMWDVGDTVKFAFTSTKPVLFNVHYHVDHVKHYPINDVLTDDFSGNFVIQNKEIHCGLWQNNNDEYVKLTFNVEVTK